MQQTISVTINFKGGIVSPGYLKDVLEAASAAHVTHVSFGLRQQLMMNVAAEKFAIFESICNHKNILFQQGRSVSPNIVSSYSAANIFINESWLSEGVYKDVFDLFTYQPKLKINICDSKQSFVPLFTGHFNLLSSNHSHFWYLYLRFPKTNIIYCWPDLIYTNDIANVSEQIEKIILNDHSFFVIDEYPDGNALYNYSKKKEITYISKPVEEPVTVPDFYLPYYEGFNKINNKFWLGIYRRDELFSVDFMKEICDVCLETKIGQLYTTPWKTIIIKGIEASQRKLWDYILGKYRINVRHAANELNWQVEDNNEDGLILKRQIIRYFDKEDVRTYGLSFAIKTKPSSSMFGSVIITKRQKKNSNRLKSLDRFDILYTRNFNPNTDELILFRENVEKEHLGTYLVSLCKFFYEQEACRDNLSESNAGKASMQVVNAAKKILYQCSNCFTVYDEQIGDVPNGIVANTLFADLPETYCCALCEASKESFIEIEEASLILSGV
ncbi:high molecular weight rubredoxin [mine drainage metagenome]|uniref:High molecular weight rubredoxin n=1 Tax=mine drainage metagenome TaxID=410659 RepID=A0A1J5RCX8_9ZZZZ